jgi:PAS domain S-box-containing protein
MSTPPKKSDRKLRRGAEEKLESGAPNPETLKPIDAQRLLHESQVHQIELDMQNKELRHAIAEKEAIEALYKDLYEFAPVGYFNLCPDGIIHSVNLTGAGLLGVERNLLVHKRLDAFISDETRPQFHELLKKVFADDFKQTCEAVFVTKHKAPLYAQIEAVATESRKNCRAVIIDITERKRAAEAAIESEERYRLLAETMLQGVVHHTADGTIISMNSAAERILGKNREELLGSDSVQVEHQTIRENGAHFPGLEHPAMVALQTGQPVADVVMGVFNPKLAEYRWINVNAVPVYRQHDTCPSEVYAVFEDITERKQAEAALRENEARLRLAQESASVGIWDWKVDIGSLDFTPELNKLYGLPPGTIRTYQDWRDRVHPNDIGMVETRRDEAIAKHEPFSLEFRVLHSSGEYRWLVAKGGAIYDDAGTTVRVLGVNIDITERKHADEALKESEDLYRGIGESIDYGVWVCAPDGRNTYASESFLKMVGITQEECANFGWGDVLHPDDAERTIAKWQECVRTGGKWDIEHRFRGTDGRWHYVLARGVPIKNEHGEIKCWAGINLDISRLKQVEEELMTARANLEQNVAERTEELALTINHLQNEFAERQQAEITLSRETAERLLALEALREKEQMLIQQSRLAAMGEMIGNIAHQWRQPLNLLGLTTQQLLMYYDMGEFDRKFLAENVEVSMKLIHHMSKTIDDFRNFFKPDKEKNRFRVQEAITDTLTLLDGSLHNPSIKVEIVANDDPVINGYANEFAQVILNLVINAKDVFTEREVSDAKLTITVSSENGFAVVTVADNAGGVPEEIIDKIFEPYFTTKGPQGGTGVGLFMSKTIIEKNMGGKLAVCNKENGAEFRIEVCN